MPHFVAKYFKIKKSGVFPLCHCDPAEGPLSVIASPPKAGEAIYQSHAYE